MEKGKSILITGGTGYAGRALARHILDHLDPKVIRIYSRDEFKQSEFAKEFNDPRLRFIIGDIRDKQTLSRACQDIDYIIHAAALKRIEAGEYNPEEFIKTNIVGSMNLVDAAIKNGVEKVVALSTDKAAASNTLYGSTKACMEKVITASNVYNRKLGQTKLCCTRYGNVIGSTGSLLPTLKKQFEERKPLTLTDERMTRFWLKKEEAIKIVMTAFKEVQGGEIFIPKCDKTKIIDIVKSVVKPNTECWEGLGEYPIEIIGIRPGEKLYETLITEAEGSRTYDCGDHYIIAPEFLPFKIKGKKVKDGFEYNSKIK